MSKRNLIWLLMAFFFIADLAAAVHKGNKEVVLSEQSLRDKVKGAWAGQTLGCSYGGPTEFKFLGTIIQDYIPIPWDKHTVKNWYDTFPGLYDDVYVDLTFVEVFERCGLDAPIDSFATAFGRTEYPLWHANQVARYRAQNEAYKEVDGEKRRKALPVKELCVMAASGHAKRNVYMGLHSV